MSSIRLNNFISETVSFYEDLDIGGLIERTLDQTSSAIDSTDRYFYQALNQDHAPKVLKVGVATGMMAFKLLIGIPKFFISWKNEVVEANHVEGTSGAAITFVAVPISAAVDLVHSALQLVTPSFYSRLASQDTYQATQSVVFSIAAVACLHEGIRGTKSFYKNIKEIQVRDYLRGVIGQASETVKNLNEFGIVLCELGFQMTEGLIAYLRGVDSSPPTLGFLTSTPKGIGVTSIPFTVPVLITLPIIIGKNQNALLPLSRLMLMVGGDGTDKPDSPLLELEGGDDFSDLDLTARPRQLTLPAPETLSHLRGELKGGDDFSNLDLTAPSRILFKPIELTTNKSNVVREVAIRFAGQILDAHTGRRTVETLHFNEEGEIVGSPEITVRDKSGGNVIARYDVIELTNINKSRCRTFGLYHNDQLINTATITIE